MKPHLGALLIIGSCLYMYIGVVIAQGSYKENDGDREIKSAVRSRNILSPQEHLAMIERLNVDLNLRTGKSCKCTWPINSEWEMWSMCERGTPQSCFESIQHRTRQCRNECYRVQMRRCQKAILCSGEWGPWLTDDGCNSNGVSATATRFCYSSDGRLGSYCNATRDEFYQEKQVICKQSNPALVGGPAKNVNSNPSWLESSQGYLIFIILAVLAGVFCVALIFVSIMLVALRRSVRENSDSKGRSVSESTVSANSCLTTIADKDVPNNTGYAKYHQITATQILATNNAGDLSLTKAGGVDVIIAPTKVKDSTNKKTSSEESEIKSKYVNADSVKSETEGRKSTNRQQSEHESRRSNLSKKMMNRKSDKMPTDEENRNSSPSYDERSENDRTAPGQFQSLPHMRKDHDTSQKNDTKPSRFSAGKAGKTDVANQSGELQNSGDAFSGWEHTQDTKSASLTPRRTKANGDNKSTPSKPKRPASNTFLFSTQAYNSLQRSKAPARPPPKNNNFKVDYNMLTKKAAVGNIRDRGGTDDSHSRVAANDQSRPRAEVEFQAYASVLDAKPVDADTVSNGSAYADVWDAAYSKSTCDNDEDDYSEVFDAKSNARNAASARAFARRSHENSNRSLPNPKSRNTIHESPTHFSYQSMDSKSSRSHSRNIPLPAICKEDDVSDSIPNEPIYCAI